MCTNYSLYFNALLYIPSYTCTYHLEYRIVPQNDYLKNYDCHWTVQYFDISGNFFMNDSQAYEILINWLSQLNLPCCEIVYTRDNVMECYITA